MSEDISDSILVKENIGVYMSLFLQPDIVLRSWQITIFAGYLLFLTHTHIQ